MSKHGTIILTILICLFTLIAARAQGQSAAPSPNPQESEPPRQVAPNNQPTTDASQNATAPASPGQDVIDPYEIGLGWHPAAMQDFPKDKYGLVDWVAILNQKLISPRSSIDPDAQEIPPFNLEIVMPTKVGTTEGAHFPHSIHTTWLACESCHVKIFIPQIGANDLTMSRIAKGEACGVCHGKVSFPLNHCERCHVPEAETGNSTTTGTN